MESKGNTLVSPFMKEEITTDGFFNGRNLFEDMPAALYTCDAEGKITFFNQAAADLWGRTPEIGKDSWCGSWKIFDTSGFPVNHDQCPMAATLKERRKIENQEMVIERPDGKRIYVLPHPKPLFDAKGNMTGAINMLVDITYIKVKENQEMASSKTETPKNLTLMDSEERYHKMIDEIQDYAILLLNKDGYILNWNQGAEKIKGYLEEEILGKNFRVFYLPEDQEAQLPERLISEASTKGKATHEGWRVRKDGTKFWGYVVITTLHDDYKNVIGFSKVTRDLTERKKAEDQLRYYAQNIESQNKQLEQYAYIASHDLQEPLRKIRVFAGILEENIENHTIVKTNIDKINTAASRMSALITDILKYSQLSQLDKLFQPTNLNEVLNSVKEDFDLIMEEKGVLIESSQLPVLNGIPMQLHQLFANLISNAIKFSRENPVIKISYRKISNEKVAECPDLPFENTYHQISFTDNGIGFEQQYADQAFKLFHRLHEKTSGTGIGLALCKKIIENHKGYICVHSEPGKGATFTVFFPV
ncbi:PAS domain S-box-containing protein [Flavobacterium arsenatis]|uniref:histidine kinase n=1 Tax=Flavobacterium arsenatis TaxID=1484332 RepID=A0ABU1TUT8_9FLAO|nr:PAS domain S-box protein [Flavobacterium arsenatis]MDR6969643.1 PAS domain S-box-containing protein [Flavobacterium arsenatis]